MLIAPLAFIFWHALFLTVLYALSMTIFSNALGLAIETGIASFYFLLLIFYLFPTLPGKESRSNFFRLVRMGFFPCGSVSFSEILVVDALTSLSKVFKDVGVTIVAVAASFKGINILDYHNHAMIMIAILATLPFW